MRRVNNIDRHTLSLLSFFCFASINEQWVVALNC